MKQTLNLQTNKYKLESLIYLLHRLNCHIQDETLCNGRMLEDTLLLVFSSQFFTKYGNMNSIFHSHKISARNKF